MKYVLIIVTIFCSSCIWHDPWRTENYTVSEVFPSDLFYRLEHGFLNEGDLVIYPVFVPTISDRDIRTGPYKFVINFVDHSGLINYVEVCDLRILGADNRVLVANNSSDCNKGVTKNGGNVSVVLSENLNPRFHDKEELYVSFKLQFSAATELEPIDVKIKFEPFLKKGRFVMDA